MTPATLASAPWSFLAPVVLLVCSNLFTTIAWYGHLKFKSVPLVTVILVSWGIAFVEYCFAVPANRIGWAPASSPVDGLHRVLQRRAGPLARRWTQHADEV